MVATSKTPRQELIDQVKTLLGNNVIDVDLTLEDYDLAVQIALERYRQRSTNAATEAFFFLTLRPEMQTYTLPKEIIEVTKIHRRGLSANAGNTTGNQYDPFSLAYTNLYLLQPTGQGDLLTYEYYNQWLETAGKLFGSEYDFRWDSNQHKLTIIRHQQVHEDVVLSAWKVNSDNEIIEGTYSRPWIRSYSLAQAKFILGQAYEKFSSIPGPQGAITLNGAQLKAEATTEMANLEEEIKRYSEGGRPLPPLIG